jgi:phosphoenolpyruvate synthase/pyruvate phosphate dikinase
MEKPPQFLLWPEVFVAGSARCGGKGWNLARLHRYGFNVPIGGVLTTDGYIHILRSTPIADLLQDLRSVASEEAAKPGVMAVLDLLRHNIESAELPPLFAKELDEFLCKLGCEHARMAVRSSATAEDSSNASFAGMHRSFLNVEGTASIASAILGCYASLWTPRALAYRRRMGFKDTEVCCAVVLCAMVTHERGGEPESAGGGIYLRSSDGSARPGCDQRCARRV